MMATSTQLDQPTALDFRYNPRLTVPNAPTIIARWQHQSEQIRARSCGYFDVPYGPGPADRLDIFLPEGNCHATVLFIHGGYWRAFNKADFSFVASELVQAGVCVAIADYALCPFTTVRQITMQMVGAASWLFRNAGNFGAPAHRLHTCGHSAGGHLVAMLLACQWPRHATDLPDKVLRGGLAISGLYDLREIAMTPSINADVRLTTKEARALSPAFMVPATDSPLYTAVGQNENEGFHIQNALIARKWPDVLKRDIACPDDNHFSVLERLLDRNSSLFQAILEMVEA